MPSKNVIETWLAGVASAILWLWVHWGMSWLFPTSAPDVPGSCVNLDSGSVLVLSWIAFTAGSSLFWFNYFRDED